MGFSGLLGPLTCRKTSALQLAVEPVTQNNVLAWLEDVSQFREQVASRRGILPDRAIEIAENRSR